MKKLLAILVSFCIGISAVYAAEFDSSIDYDIRKQYNVDELPALPNVSPNKVEMPKEAVNYNATGKVYTIKGGTKIILISKGKVSSWSSEGAKISFISQNQIVTKEGTVIPSGTLFKGTVVNSHRPQMTGNGGLVKLKINEIYFNGVMSSIDTKLTDANSKKVFRNDIKGKRKYWQNCSKAMTPGKKTYKVMKNIAKGLTPYPVINILSIVPFAIGGTIYLTNAAIAPLASVFMKGASVSIPQGTAFHVSVLGNNQIRG